MPLDKIMTQTIDFDTIEMLRDVMEDDFVELIETFLNDAQTKLNTLPNLVNSGDSQAVRMIAHSLKGSSSNLGALPMSQLCLTLEQNAKSEDLALAPQVLVNLQDEYAKVRILLMSYLPS